jgi:hypothetical protein
MNFHIIEYNIHASLKKVIFWCNYLLLFIIWITSIYDFKWILLFNLFLWLVYSYFVKIYQICGECSLNKDEIIIREKGAEYVIKSTGVKYLAFFYGGFKGEMRPLEILFTGSNFRDGTKNFLLIRENDEKQIRILIKNKNDFNYITSFIDEFKLRGTDTRIVKKSFSFTP